MLSVLPLLKRATSDLHGTRRTAPTLTRGVRALKQLQLLGDGQARGLCDRALPGPQPAAPTPAALAAAASSARHKLAADSARSPAALGLAAAMWAVACRSDACDLGSREPGHAELGTSQLELAPMLPFQGPWLPAGSLLDLSTASVRRRASSDSPNT